MTQRLPPILSSSDLPFAELLAARLDGEVFRVDDCFAPVDEIEQPMHRARALRAGLPDRFIAEQRSAAWIWGALEHPPLRHQLCAAVGARVRPPGPGWLMSREVVIEPSEVVILGGMRLTTPLRTAIDLARFSRRFGPAEEQIVHRLMRLGGFTIGDCYDDMNRRRNLPNRRQAVQRLRPCGP